MQSSVAPIMQSNQILGRPAFLENRLNEAPEQAFVYVRPIGLVRSGADTLVSTNTKTGGLAYGQLSKGFFVAPQSDDRESLSKVRAVCDSKLRKASQEHDGHGTGQAKVDPVSVVAPSTGRRHSISKSLLRRVRTESCNLACSDFRGRRPATRQKEGLIWLSK